MQLSFCIFSPHQQKIESNELFRRDRATLSSVTQLILYFETGKRLGKITRHKNVYNFKLLVQQMRNIMIIMQVCLFLSLSKKVVLFITEERVLTLKTIPLIFDKILQIQVIVNLPISVQFYQFWCNSANFGIIPQILVRLYKFWYNSVNRVFSVVFFLIAILRL